MTAFTDSMVGFGVVVVFFYFIYSQIASKYPKFEEMVSSWFSPLHLEVPKFDESERREQIWKEHAMSI